MNDDPAATLQALADHYYLWAEMGGQQAPFEFSALGELFDTIRTVATLDDPQHPLNRAVIVESALAVADAAGVTP